MSQRTYLKSKHLNKTQQFCQNSKFMIMDYLPCQCKLPIQNWFLAYTWSRACWALGAVRAYNPLEVRMKSSFFDVQDHMHTGVLRVICSLEPLESVRPPTGSVQALYGPLQMPYGLLNIRMQTDHNQS